MTCWSQLSGRHHRSEQPEHQRSKPSPREPAYLTLTSARGDFSGHLSSHAVPSQLARSLLSAAGIPIESLLIYYYIGKI